jgi:hypothetical protein
MRTKPYLLALCLLVLLSGCSTSEVSETAASSNAMAGQEDEEDPGEYGPGLVQVHVVRSLTIRVTGGMNETITGSKADEHTTLIGECKPDLFANLSFDTGSMMDDHAGAAFVTKEPITIGQTGEIPLDWVDFDSAKLNNGNPIMVRFHGKGGQLTITTHNTAPGNRRFTGTFSSKNLEPVDGPVSKPIDVEVAFDADFSCGIR